MSVGKKIVGNKIAGIRIFALMPVIMGAALLIIIHALKAGASVFPTPDEVLQSYRNDPYKGFYEGSRGIAWTSLHPGGYEVNSNGVYVYSGSGNKYRGAEGTEVVPSGVIGRKDPDEVLPPGHHYYARPITNDVVPVGKWVLEHPDGKCVHGPFAAGRDFEYYGISGLSNDKCGRSYDSGWKGYCADCGEPVAGFVYADKECVKNTGYIFVGDSVFSQKYPVEYVFVCPECGDNMEVSFSRSVHMCRSYISCNRYTVRFDPNCTDLQDADTHDMDPQVFYYGGAHEYEGEEVSGGETLSPNEYIRKGYIFCGWSDTPSGEAVFEDGACASLLESHYAVLNASGDGSDNAVITLYAVWKESDCALEISAGTFDGHPGYYDGVVNGEYEDDKNRFTKGYMYSTYIDDGKLTPPEGYSIVLNTITGEDACHSETYLAGWVYESTDPGASEADVGNKYGFIMRGSLSGKIERFYSDGSVSYLHSSVIKGNTDRFTALWKSGGFTLPDAAGRGLIFEGWYSSPDLSDDSYVGKAGDLIFPVSDMELYASYKGITLSATPDYMGSEKFGELRYKGITDLSVGERGDDLLYKYFYSDSPYGGWKEAVTEEGSTGEVLGRRDYYAGGEDREITVQVTGIYKISLWGGSGASYEGYPGVSGDMNECEVLLKEGDRIRIHTGIKGESDTGDDGVICGGGEGSELYINDELFMSASGGDGASFLLDVDKRFDHTGTVQTFTVTAEADYRLQVYGAKGGSAGGGQYVGANGGFAEGTVHLMPGTVLYICAGGMNGYNGGALGGLNAYGSRGGSGGGATHIASSDGLLSSFDNKRGDIYLVAGGGGGAGGSAATSGTGGGLRGGNGRSPWPGGECTAYGGTQTAAGLGSFKLPGGFGFGGRGYSYKDNGRDHASVLNGGGGGGWYGGGGGDADALSYGSGGGGGSGYIGGVTDGRMSNGVSVGNGYAIISCKISVTGEPHYGAETDFRPCGLRYRGQKVLTGDDVTYPDEAEEGDGGCIIKAPDVRYYENADCSVSTPDLAAPDKVEDAGLVYNSNTGKVCVVWNMPRDNGTVYYFTAGAYRADDVLDKTDDFSLTPCADLTLVTGVYGYRYVIDESKERDREYVFENGTLMDTAWTPVSGSAPNALFSEWYKNASSQDLKCSGAFFSPDGSDRYIHIVAIDRAGNVSDVFDMAVDGKNAFIPYPVVTEKLRIVSGENVFRSPDRQDTYYVRAGDDSPFSLVFSAYINGPARQSYQIEKAQVCVSGSEHVTYTIEKSDILQEDASPNCTDYVRTAAFPFVPSPPEDILRSSHASGLSFRGSYITLSEEEFTVYPAAAAFLERNLYGDNQETNIVHSDLQNDRLNGIRLIGDATPPKCMVSVGGGEYTELSLCDISNEVSGCIIDRRKEDVRIDIRVFDEGSGVKQGFKVKIINTDNGYEDEFSESGTHLELSLKRDSDSEEPAFENMLYNGDFHIEVSSEDNVGNIYFGHSEKITELDASAEIVRLLDAVSGPLFNDEGNRCMKAGESGLVRSSVWGYPDAVLVSFDDMSLSGFDTLYVINDTFVLPFESGAETVRIPAASYLLTLETEFTIPLEYKGRKTGVTVTAFKDGERVRWHAFMSIDNLGSVLDELYSVLR